MEKVVVTKRGYLQKIWTDPETGKLRREFVHRLVWMEHNGPIPEGFHVHHKDGDKTNNEISNLELLSDSMHAREHNDSNPSQTWAWRRFRKK